MASLGHAVDSTIHKVSPKALNAGSMAVKSGKEGAKLYGKGMLRSSVALTWVGLGAIAALISIFNPVVGLFATIAYLMFLGKVDSPI